jgi:hypothetical protein
MEMLDELELTHLNDGTLTRIPRPPSRGSAIDLSLTSHNNLFDFNWTVLDDNAGRDHNPILISLSDISTIQTSPKTPNPIPHIINWKCFTKLVDEILTQTDMTAELSID